LCFEGTYIAAIILGYYLILTRMHRIEDNLDESWEEVGKG